MKGKFERTYKLLCLALALCLLISTLPGSVAARALGNVKDLTEQGSSSYKLPDSDPAPTPATPVDKSVSAVAQNGTSLEGSCNLSIDRVHIYSWTIDKKVSPSSWDLYDGQQGVSTYTVTVGKSCDYTDIGVFSGSVTVKNKGSVPTENLSISVDVTDPSGNAVHASANVNTSAKPVLNSGESYSYPYKVQYDGISPFFYKVVAHINITNHSGHLGTPWGPDPKSDSEMYPCSWDTSDVNASINVDDTNGMTWSFNKSGSVTYNKTFTTANAGVNNNTATIRQTGQSDSAKVTINRLQHKYSVTFQSTGPGHLNGTLTQNNITEGTAWNSSWVPTLVPDTGAHFVGWTPSFPSSVTSSQTFTATFAYDVHSVTFSKSGPGSLTGQTVFASIPYGTPLVHCGNGSDTGSRHGRALCGLDAVGVPEQCHGRPCVHGNLCVRRALRNLQQVRPRLFDRPDGLCQHPLWDALVHCGDGSDTGSRHGRALCGLDAVVVPEQCHGRPCVHGNLCVRRALRNLQQVRPRLFDRPDGLCQHPLWDPLGPLR